MTYQKISCDVKLAALRLYEPWLLRLQEILTCCSISKRTWFCILKLWRETGDIVNHPTGMSGRPRQLDHEDLEYLVQLIRSNPDYLLDELVTLLHTNWFISIHFSTVFSEIQRAGVSCKKLKRITAERDEGHRAAFIAHMAQYDATEIGFIDEVLKDERTVWRQYGWSWKGSRLSRSSHSFVVSNSRWMPYSPLMGYQWPRSLRAQWPKLRSLSGWNTPSYVFLAHLWPSYSHSSSYLSVLRIPAPTASL